ncbi:hypothetical protein AB6N22_12840, partial [Kocuria palustris]|uniref:hypothetical protein n=2 Tax=Bacillati TaxID=1783272 RepID=UPI0039A0D0AD
IELAKKSDLDGLAKKSELDSLKGNVQKNGADISNLSTNVATLSGEVAKKSDEGHTHSYNDLTNKPSIPTKTSQLQNDSKFITSVKANEVPITVEGLTATNVQAAIAELKTMIDGLSTPGGEK